MHKPNQKHVSITPNKTPLNLTCKFSSGCDFWFAQILIAKFFKKLDKVSRVNLISYALKFTSFRVDKFKDF